MGSTTDNLQLYKATSGSTTETFNVETMLNENWDKIDEKVNENSDKVDELTTSVDTNTASLAEITDYQTPTISGTQIQLARQSNTNRLFFKLDADLSGGDITISLDGGATEVNLIDIDGNNVTELSKGFVEVVDNGVNFTYAPKGGAAIKSIQKLTMSSISTASINSVDLTKAIVVGAREGLSTPERVYFNSSTQIGRSSSSGIYYADVIEFNRVKSLQTINTSISTTTSYITNVDVTISSIDTSKSRLYFSYIVSPIYASRDWMEGIILDESTIRFTFQSDNGNVDHTITAYVVEFE